MSPDTMLDNIAWYRRRNGPYSTQNNCRERIINCCNLLAVNIIPSSVIPPSTSSLSIWSVNCSSPQYCRRASPVRNPNRALSTGSAIALETRPLTCGGTRPQSQPQSQCYGNHAIRGAAGAAGVLAALLACLGVFGCVSSDFKAICGR